MSVVSIVKLADGDVKRTVRRALRLCGVLESLHWEGATVLVKPNACAPVASGSGIVTDVRVVEAVTEIVLERNPARVVIGDGSSVGYVFPDNQDSMSCLRVAGYADVSERLDVELIDLNRDIMVQVHAPDAFVMDSFSVAKTVLDADIVIDLPVIKTHLRTGITCGLKNMKGVLPGDEKKLPHRLGLDRAIVDLNRAVKPTLTVVDAIMGAQGSWGVVGEPDGVPLESIIAGSDVVAVDAVSAAVAGFDPQEILHVKLAAEANLGVADLSRIEIKGERIESVRRPFIPFLQAARELFGGATVIEKSACTGCMGECVSAFIYLNKAGFSHRLPELKLIMGMPDEVPLAQETPVIVGRCSKEHQHLGVFVAGCPPHGISITKGICEALGIDWDGVHRTVVELHG